MDAARTEDAGRTLMSAWIETEKYIITNKINYSRTLMSAWIETRMTTSPPGNLPCRTLMSAWIETVSVL